SARRSARVRSLRRGRVLRPSHRGRGGFGGGGVCLARARAGSGHQREPGGTAEQNARGHRAERAGARPPGGGRGRQWWSGRAAAVSRGLGGSGGGDGGGRAPASVG